MATTKNDITGDVIQSKGTTEKYRDGWERIFGKAARERALDDLVAEGQQLGMYDNNKKVDLSK